MSVGERIAAASNRFYLRVRHPDAWRPGVATDAHGFEGVRGHKYALVTTFRRSGEPVPTPIWFGIDDGGTLYFRTEAASGKVKRLRNDGRVLVAPSTFRGRPLGPAVRGRARILPSAEEERAEAALAANYGLGRKFYEGTAGQMGVDAVYVAVAPEATTSTDGAA